MTTIIQLEIAGPTALWTRLDSGSCPQSYPAPTFSAAKGIFECVRNWQRLVVVTPTRTEICAPVQHHRFTTNYGGALRKQDQIRKGAAFQLHAEVLINVLYRLYAQVEFIPGATGPIFGSHAAQEYSKLFNRVLQSGRFHHMPFLGLKEFVPSYVGSFRPETSVCETENHCLPAMHHAVFDRPRNGKIAPSRRLNVTIVKGVLTYV